MKAKEIQWESLTEVMVNFVPDIKTIHSMLILNFRMKIISFSRQRSFKKFC